MKKVHFLFFLLFTSTSQASYYIADHDFFTTIQTMDWLDVTLTLGDNYNTLDGQIASGTINTSAGDIGTGWRRATGEDFEELMLSFGLIAASDPCLTSASLFCANTSLGTNNPAVNDAISLLGDTGKATHPSSTTTSIFSGKTSGFLSDFPDSNPTSRFVAEITDNDGLRINSDFSLETFFFNDSVITHSFSLNPESTLDARTLNAGHWLVRDTVDANAFAGLAPVPIPAAVWLFGSGLLGLIGVAGRKKA